MHVAVARASGNIVAMDRSTDPDHADAVATAVLACTLPKPEWTHEAHLAFGVDSRPPASRTRELSGYHETLTAYDCRAVARLQRDGRSFDDVVVHAMTSRSAPFVQWDRDVLMATPARRG